MSNVVKFTGHKRTRCRQDPPCGECFTCILFACSTCGGAEASLPTHCPGARMSSLIECCVQDGTADYRNGQWHFVLKNGERWRTTDG